MSFESLVAKLMKEGKSRESAEKIAGSVANAKMHGAGSGPTEAQKRRHGMKQMKTNQDGGDASTTEAADQLKELGSPAKRMNRYDKDMMHDRELIYDATKQKEYHPEDTKDDDLLIHDTKDQIHRIDQQKHAATTQMKSFAKQFNAKSPMARLNSPVYKHGAMKGDQSATHTDYANYKGTDKGYHGHTGSSHGDQSATHRDYMHPILKHMKR